MDAPQLHMTNPDGSINPNFAAALADLVTSDDEKARCFGRAVGSGLTPAVMDWVNAEIERRTEPAVIMVALAELQIQQLASIAGNFVTPAGTDVVIEMYRTMLDTNFAAHAQKIRTMLASASEASTEQTG